MIVMKNIYEVVNKIIEGGEAEFDVFGFELGIAQFRKSLADHGLPNVLSTSLYVEETCCRTVLRIPNHLSIRDRQTLSNLMLEALGNLRFDIARDADPQKSVASTLN